MRAKTLTDTIRMDLIDSIDTVRQTIDRTDPAVDEAWSEIETFCAIALRIIAKTNPSKVRDAAMAEEIKARMQGREVLE
jgi:hypothetical protein